MGEIQKLQELFNKVGEISEIREKRDRYEGKNFNIFSIMNMESDERYTHSAIIGELLNPNGRHNQGSVYLKLFFDEIKNLVEKLSFDIKNAKIILEEHIGYTDENYTKGGFIDIVIKDKKNVIVIENKIYAEDQEGQLVRYKNHYKYIKEQNFLMLYLNLFGGEPADFSKRELKKDEDFHIITYTNHIQNWITNAIKHNEKSPFIRNNLEQYLLIIKKLTNQNTNEMSEELRKLITIENVDSIKMLGNEFNHIENEVRNDIFNYFNEKLKSLRFKINSNIDLRLTFDKDSRFYLSNYEFNKQENLTDYETLANILKADINNNNFNVVGSNSWFILSFESDIIGFNFNKLSNADILEIFNKTKNLKYFTEKILYDLKEIKSIFEKKINQGEIDVSKIYQLIQ